MIREMNLQVISGFGWYEIIGGKIKTRKDGMHELGDTPPPRLHIHPDGIAITGLPPSAIEWILKSIIHDSYHDDTGRKQVEPSEKTITLTIRTG